MYHTFANDPRPLTFMGEKNKKIDKNAGGSHKK
jgi:hypothetical protein